MKAAVTFSAASQALQKGQYTKSLEMLNQLIDVQKDAKTYALLAKTLEMLGMKADAARAYILASEQPTQNVSEYQKQALRIYFELQDDEQVLLIGMKLFIKHPNEAEIAYALASIFLKQGKDDLLPPFRKPLTDSSNPKHLHLATRLLTNDLGDETNLHLARKILSKYAGDATFRFIYLIFCREFCEYDAVEKHQRDLDAIIASGNHEIFRKDNAFYNFTWCGDESINRLAEATTPTMPANITQERRQVPHVWGEKIRVGYLSADFFADHATMKLLRRVLEVHDRHRFDVTLFCHTPLQFITEDDTLRSQWGKVVRIHDLSDQAAAQLIREHNIDVLVDLKGHTHFTRAAILNHKTAPVHVSWLGYPGSTIRIDLDYVIGDPYVLPEVCKPHYDQKLARLPESYQPNDAVHRPLPQPVSRAELGLPEDAFVFASFNANRKISLKTIELWTRILKRTKNSVIWIMTQHPRTEANIIKKLQQGGISSKRIFFAPKLKFELHLNRLPAADLALDTFPCNGHTTTSEQLWSGLPVLTVKGTHFASRVSESLLNAIGLPELVAQDVDEYEEMAVALAEDRGRVAAYKERLIANRFIKPLFDAERLCRHLEKAYEMMVERARAGLEPDHIDVPALPARAAPFLDRAE